VRCRCGQETRVVPRILQMRNHWYKSSKESLRLKEAGVSEEVINSAVASFILEVIARHGVPAPRLCNKDPLALKSMDYLKVLFPNAKYIFMVRDGRATVHSIISRKVSINFNIFLFIYSHPQTFLNTYTLYLYSMYKLTTHNIYVYYINTKYLTIFVVYPLSLYIIYTHKNIYKNLKILF